MRNRFLRRRIGLLLCMLGMICIAGALSYHQYAVSYPVSVAVTDDRILIVDAGHGGDDGGAVSASGVQEADLNLEISNRLRALAQLYGVHTIMTRSSADIAYPEDADSIAKRKVADQRQRVALINSIQNAVLISIHQNQYPTPGPHGAQVLYGSASDSDALGKQIQSMLVAHLDPQNRRVAAPISGDIYLMKNISCPAVLIECGFLSNPDECARLQTEAYQTQLAITLLSSYLQFMQDGCLI